MKVVMRDTCCRYVLTAGHCVDFCSMKIDPDCRRSDPFPQINIKVDTTILYVQSLCFEQYVKVTLGDHNHKDKVKPSPIQHYHVTKVYHDTL